MWPQIERYCVEFVEDAIRDYVAALSDDDERLELLSETSSLATVDGRMIMNEMRTRLLGNNSNPGLGTPYITSFARHTDEFNRQNGMLSQWRGYGADEPIALVLATKALEWLLETECTQFEYFSCSLSDVIYFDENFSLTDCFPEFVDSLRAFANHTIQQKNIADTGVQKNLNDLSARLLPAVGRIKHIAFREENECRIIVGLPDHSFREEFNRLGGQPKPFKDIHYRAGYTGVIPYIRLFETLQEKVPISRILIGPSRTQQATFEKVSDIVSASGRGKEISITASETPYVVST